MEYELNPRVPYIVGKTRGECHALMEPHHLMADPEQVRVCIPYSMWMGHAGSHATSRLESAVASGDPGYWQEDRGP